MALIANRQDEKNSLTFFAPRFQDSSCSSSRNLWGNKTELKVLIAKKMPLLF